MIEMTYAEEQALDRFYDENKDKIDKILRRWSNEVANQPRYQYAWFEATPEQLILDFHANLQGWLLGKSRTVMGVLEILGNAGWRLAAIEKQKGFNVYWVVREL